MPLHSVSSRSANPRAPPWFESEAFRSAFQVISEALETGTRVILLLGDGGAGKSTLMRALREVQEGAGRGTLRCDARAIHGLRALQDDSSWRNRAAACPIAFVDDADRLSRDRLVEILALADRGRECPLQLILSARPELWLRLQQRDHDEINSRIELSATLGPLRRSELGYFLRHRLLAAGRQDVRFDQAALEKLYAYSRGNAGIVDRIAARLVSIAATIIGVADIDAAIASLDAGRAGGRLTVAQFGANAPGGPASLARAAGTRRGKVVAAGAALSVAVLALAAASLLSWKGGVAEWAAALSLTYAPPAPVSAEHASSARMPAVQPTGTSVPVAPLLAASERNGSRELMPDSIDDARVQEEPASTTSQQEISPATVSTPSFAGAPALPGDNPGVRSAAPETDDTAPAQDVVPIRAAPAPLVEAPSHAAVPPSRVPTTKSPNGNAEAGAFMTKGFQLLDAGDVASARLLFERAADSGLPEACTAMGQTFDPAELARRRIIGIKGQPETALKWYRLGDERGDPLARQRMSQLAGAVP